ncbi:3D-(3,5/4)-trihydroxycyclohexane-1,2-dione acylhydrolase (decyclizing) [Paucibacter sp. R3-3]|uniref:3D-(3,5/4)-trihydroxycyclohexane-1,2-dione acylhydrolase (Decyclizing) n=1 Tax=Roseateles agri TaxID=3098619 RepID=A0ABU5DGX4_9BURK|nr:3D-(3,5/4)-trihydroxycyclohexane-1,2-dione acylhydrolase (decyclizing) [Paucibacter sp. R3-3]MDY0745534.1 3D-(3,5/4)-trihydroxycyclohexane-1,2-dione acylhydrolase (decyclizing) [Paucibacter sp. R3-3]
MTRKTQRLTMAQALVRRLAAQQVETAAGSIEPYCAGVFAIFGHGNVAGLGEALWAERSRLPTYRAHNEQGMAHAAVAYAKAQMRERVMAVTSSIGPGATNLLTAAAVAHVDRLPVLLLPSDTFISRAPDPVLQQIENFGQGDMNANDAFRPLVRYFDRISRPEQILTALPRAIQVMTDAALCGPVCLALPQDVQAEAFDCPEDFLQPDVIRFRRLAPDAGELARAAALLRTARRPLLVAGGGVLYSHASEALRAFAEAHGIPVAESHGGKSSLAWDHPLNAGAIGVDGGPAANELAREADLVIAVGTRLQDFTTGSNALFPQAALLCINVQPFDTIKGRATGLVSDARLGLQQLGAAAAGWHADAAWTERSRKVAAGWNARVTEITTATVAAGARPYDGEVIGAVRDSAADSAAKDIAVCAAGTLPAELHKLWRASAPGGYHVEYGYSCMGYEIAGGVGIKLAQPEREVIVFVGDGSYMMMNSEISTSLLLGTKLIVVVLDNQGYGCIERLQGATGSAQYNNMLETSVAEGGVHVPIDFAAHARAMGAEAVHVKSLGELKSEMTRARKATRTQVLVIDTTHKRTTEGGCWWEVGVPEVSTRPEVQAAHEQWQQGKLQQRI